MNNHALASLTGLGLALATAAGQPAATIGLLPDTQYYSETAGWTRHFNNQTAWLASRRDLLNIRFVCHLGDIVDNGARIPEEWTRARNALSTLRGVIPHSVCLGNHDYQTVSDKTSGNQQYIATFGPVYHAAEPGYLGSDPSGGNHALLVDLGGGLSMIQFAFEWRPDAAVFAWARTILDAHPGIPAMISTHEHVRDPDNTGSGAGRSAAGEDTWSRFIRPEPRVFMIVNGHFHSGQAGYAGEYHQLSLNAQSLVVPEMLSDYQGWAEGGSGYMRLVELDVHNSMMHVRTFSPSLGRYQRDHNSDMRFPIDLRSRFALESSSTLVERKFRQGLDGYTGALDVELRSAAPDTPVATGSTLNVTAAPANGGAAQVLIRFDNLFGGAGIAATDDIVCAKLRFNVTDAGSGFSVHRMLAPFSAASTWNTMAGGVSPDGLEAFAAPDAFCGGGTTNGVTPFGLLELDVTRSVQAWKAGAHNLGWAFIPHAGGTNAVSMYSSDYFLLGKPELVIWTASTPSREATFRQGENGYTSCADTELRENEPAAFLPENPSIFIDADQPSGTGLETTGLIRFTDLFGDQAGHVPASAWITSASLVLTATEPGSGFKVHRMLRSWNEWDGWSRFAGIGTDESDAMSYVEEEVGRDDPAATVQPGVLRLDVTESVRAWQAGRPNYGWALVARTAGSDGLRIASSEAPNLADRPRLVIRFTEPCPADFNRDGFLDFFDYDDYVMCFEANTCPESRTADFNGDGFVDFFDYDDFVVAFEHGC